MRQSRRRLRYLLHCGTCTAPATCGLAHSCPCTPKTCGELGATCGSVADGCGGTPDCGTCTAPALCTNNECGCTPTTCADADADCGTISDGCAGTLDGGTCSGTETCGGGGANKCGSDSGTPATCGTSTAEPCPMGAAARCQAVVARCRRRAARRHVHACGCTPKVCAAKNCGNLSTGRGGTPSCGTSPRRPPAAAAARPTSAAPAPIPAPRTPAAPSRMAAVAR